MKALIISLSAFAIMLGVTVANSLYIDSVTKNLDKMIDKLVPGDEAALCEAEKYWQENEDIICIFVSHKDVDNVNIAFEVLKEKMKNGEDGCYEYIALLKNYVAEIKKKERFHINNII